MLIAAVSVTGGMIAQRRAYIPEIEVIDAEEETAETIKAEVTAAVTYTESISTAEAIIEYRKSTPFEKPEEIMNVKGIGEKKYENIKNSICV